MSGNEEVRVLQEGPGATLTLHNLTVADGSAGASTGVSDGGVLNSGGTLRVDHSTFSNNSAFFGGGIYNDGGTLTVINSTLSGNNNGGNTNGFGGIGNNQGTLNVISGRSPTSATTSQTTGVVTPAKRLPGTPRPPSSQAAWRIAGGPRRP